jgi:N-glycosylase/DNA lyase
MGFRARYLHETARRVTYGQFDPAALRGLSLPEARERLLSLPGVGPKIADCVLLFSGDQPGAFPIDVWVSRALRRRYFGDRRVSLSRLRTFASSHFGPRAGYAQQYLFHDARGQPHAPAEAGNGAR